MEVDVANNVASVIAQEGAVLPAFTGIMAFLDLSVIRLSMKAVEVRIKSIHIDDEEVDAFFGEEVIVITTNDICASLGMNLVALHFSSITTSSTCSLIQQERVQAMVAIVASKVGATLWLLWLALAEYKLECLMWLFVCLKWVSLLLFLLGLW